MEAIAEFERGEKNEKLVAGILKQKCLKQFSLLFYCEDAVLFTVLDVTSRNESSGKICLSPLS